MTLHLPPRVATLWSQARTRVRPSDAEWWKSVGIALMALSVVICLVFVLPAANRAKSEAARSSSESRAGRVAAEEVRKGNEAATCRSTFSAAVTAARFQLDDASAAHTQALGAGLQAAVNGDDVGYLLAVADRVEANHTIDVARVVYAGADAQYQRLIVAQNDDRATFDEMCAAGPG